MFVMRSRFSRQLAMLDPLRLTFFSTLEALRFFGMDLASEKYGNCIGFDAGESSANLNIQ